MFESNDESVFKGTGSNSINSLLHVPIQRSLSAPATLQDSNDSIFGDGDDMFAASSRLNSGRLPGKNGNGIDDVSAADANGMQSLYLDTGKSKMDLIQDDFPSTPSSLYSSQVSRLSSIADGFDTTDPLLSSLDHATAAISQLSIASQGSIPVTSSLQPSLAQQLGTVPSQSVRVTAGSNANSRSYIPNDAYSPRGGSNGVQQIQYVSDSNLPQQQQQQPYYQQQVYVDQQGQPVYYRVASNNQYQDMYGNQDASADNAHLYGNMYNNSNGSMNNNSGYYASNSQDGGYSMNGNQGDASMRRVVYGNNQYPVNMQNRNMQYQSIPNQGMQLRPNDIDMLHLSRDGGMGGRNNMSMDMRGMQRNNDNYRDRNDRNGGRNNGNNNRQQDRYNDRNNMSMNNNSSAVNPMRDPLVDEFRNTYGKSRQWSLNDLTGHVVAFCQDQHGSRFIQQRLEVCNDIDKQLIFDEILPSAHMLMTDVFGNYVLQKLFEFGLENQCEALALLLAGQSVNLSMQMYGCRVVQKALEYVNTPRLIALVAEFELPPVLLRCVHDSNGNHVIQKCIEIVSKVAREHPDPSMQSFLLSKVQIILETFKGKVKELASHPYGCRVIQRTLEHCNSEQKKSILEELRECCTELVQDCYGNYVIQFIMQHGLEQDRQILIKEVQNNLLDFSQHKFASNVVEKCLQYASKPDRDKMIWTIINVTFDLNSPVDAKTGQCVLESMVRDPYANYVVQKVIDVSDERQRNAIMTYVRENIVQLRRLTYAKHILVRLEKLTNEKF